MSSTRQSTEPLQKNSNQSEMKINPNEIIRDCALQLSTSVDHSSANTNFSLTAKDQSNEKDSIDSLQQSLEKVKESKDDSNSIFDEIIKHIKSKEKDSIDLLQQSLEKAKARNIDLSLPLPNHINDFTLLDYNCEYNDIYLGFTKRELLYKYGASRMKSDWGKSFEYSRILESNSQDYYYYGNRANDYERCTKSGVEDFDRKWFFGGASKEEKLLMVEDSITLGVLKLVGIECITKHKSLGVKTLQVFSEVPGAKEFADLHTASARKAEVINAIICACESSSIDSVDDLKNALDEAKKYKISLGSIDANYDWELSISEDLLKNNRLYIVKKIKLMKEHGIPIKSKQIRSNWEPLTMISQKKQFAIFDELLPLLDVNETDRYGRTILFDFVDSLIDTVSKSGFLLNMYGIEKLEESYNRNIKNIVLLIKHGAKNIKNKNGESVIDVVLANVRFSPVGYGIKITDFFLENLDLSEEEKALLKNKKQSLNDTQIAATKSNTKVAQTTSEKSTSSSSNTSSLSSTSSVSITNSFSSTNSILRYSTFSTPRTIANDKRFTKSNKSGILYEATSYGYITDEELKSYGFKEGQWERRKDGIDNIVIIKELKDNSLQNTTKPTKA